MSNLKLFAFAVLLSVSVATLRADTAILSAGDDGTGTIEISGELVDYTGAHVTIRRADGVERDYPAARVEQIDTDWPEGFKEGSAAIEAGDYPRAAELLAAAARADRRAWVRRLAMEQLMRCYASAGDAATAGRLLVELARSDPTTPALDHAPLAWYAADSIPPATATAWLVSEASPVAQLLGASYSLAGSARGESLAALKQLTRSTDERHARLAEMQSWRAEIVTATARDVARWEERLRAMPEPLQAGGWLVVGDAHRQQRNFDSAALAYLRCNLLADRQPQLAAEALWRASQVLASAGQQDEATKLAKQLVRDLPQTAAAREARGVLQSP